MTGLSDGQLAQPGGPADVLANVRRRQPTAQSGETERLVYVHVAMVRHACQ